MFCIQICSVIYDILIMTLFAIYTHKDPYASLCDSLWTWDQSLWIVLCVCIFLHIIFAVVQHVNKFCGASEKCMAWMIYAKSIIINIAVITLLIGISINYSYIDNPRDDAVCGSLGRLTLAFIIIEWVQVCIGFCVGCILLTCLCFCSAEQIAN